MTDCAKCSACDHYTCERTTQSRACESCGDALEGTDRVIDPDDAPVAEAFVRIERAEWQGMVDRLRAELATEEAHHLRTTHMWAEVSDQMAHMVEKCGQQIARAQAAEAAIARVRAACGAKITWDRRPSKAHRDDVAYAFRLVLAALEGNQP